MAEQAHNMKHTTRTTKRGGENSKPDDPFKVEAEVSMDAVKQAPASDGRNPAISSGKTAPSERP